MASETGGLWNTLRQKLNRVPQLEYQRHEDKFASGIPDLSYSCLKVNGWVELKQADKWPAREQTELKLPHYTTAQRQWLWRHGEAGGRCWLLLQVDRDYLLFNHRQAQDVGMLTKADLFRVKTAHWQGELPVLPFVEILTGKYHA